MLMVDAAKMADAFAVLYKPFKVDYAFTPKSDDKGDTTSDRGKSHHNFKCKGNSNKPFVRNWAPEVLCIGCGRRGNTASVCRTISGPTHLKFQNLNRLK